MLHWIRLATYWFSIKEPTIATVLIFAVLSVLVASFRYHRRAMEDELDLILSQLSQHDLSTWFDLAQFLSVHASQQPLPSSSQPVPPVKPVATEPSSADGSRFALTSDTQLEEAKVAAISKNTAKSTSWCVNIWKEWSQHRQSLHPGAYSEWPIHLYLADNQQLDYWLSKFVLETRKRNGDTILQKLSMLSAVVYKDTFKTTALMSISFLHLCLLVSARFLMEK